MNNFIKSTLNRETGSALLISLLVLVVVTSLGIMATRTATIESSIAVNDKLHKIVWFATDGVVDGFMPELIEQNIYLRGFEGEAPITDYGPGITINTPDFYLNSDGGSCDSKIPSSSNRDVEVAGIGQTDVSVRVFGVVKLSDGNAIQLPEGYHGRGKGLSGGGGAIIYTINGLGAGARKSRATSTITWRHTI